MSLSLQDMNKKNGVTYVLVLLAVIIVVIIIKNFETSRSQDQMLKVGLITPLSGTLALYGEFARNGLSDALSSDPHIQLVIEDEKCDPTQALTALNKLSEVDHIDLLVGPLCGSPQEIVAPLVLQKKLLTLATSSASEKLVELSGGNMLEFQTSLEGEASFVSKNLFEKNYKKVAIVSYSNAFSQTYKDALTSSLSTYGEIQSQDFRVLNDGDDLKSLALNIKKFNPDVVFISDVTFFFHGGLDNLKRYQVSAPVYSTYATVVPGVKEVATNVVYPYPKDFDATNGPLYQISKEAGEMIISFAKKCDYERVCVEQEFKKSKQFKNGVRVQELEMRVNN